MNFNTDVTGEMIFLEKDIQISNHVIGKGAFGEVRVARWRNIDVAAKRLHPLVLEKEVSQVTGTSEIDLNHCAVVDSFHTEMETLAKLRHPNLVLFLGIACNVKTRQPSTILTELMPGSLYDILEVHKIVLTLPEILDIAIDICSGLEYLHSHDPQIVHRDISSKNILIGGNQAKIADLGQAKLFGSALSRQTGMPGAMAYSAPEVLTGRYTAKIDMFSLGILLAQMCTGEYPRIDRREDQLKAACQKYLPLQQYLNESVSFQPDDRPSSADLCSGLKELRHNDRYYPPARRQSPQCDVGVMARRYLEESVEQRCGDVRLALEQTARRLTVEEQRWRDEADRVDGIQRTADDNAAKLIACQDALSRQKTENSQLEKKLDEADSRIYEIEESNDALKTEKVDLEARLQSLQSSHEELQSEFEDFRGNHAEVARMNETAEGRVNAAKQETAFTLRREKTMQQQKDLQAEEIKELEERLEQALMRWRHEKALVVSEGERCVRLRDNCADMLEQAGKNTAEIERLTRRLNMYDSLPMPDEIKARFQDYEEDAQRNKDEVEDYLQQRREVKEQLLKTEELCNATQTSLDETESERLRLAQESEQQKQQISELGDALSSLGQRYESSSALVDILEDDKRNLLDISDKLRKKVTEKDEELAAMRVARRKERKNIAAGGGAGAAAGGGGDDGSVVSRITNEHEEGEDEYDDDDDPFEKECKDEEEKDKRRKDKNKNKNKIKNNEQDDDEEEDPFDESKSIEVMTDMNKQGSSKENKEAADVVDNKAAALKKSSSLPQFGSGTANGIMALVRAATMTRQTSDIMADSNSANSVNDLLERKRKMDADAKLRIQQATEHGGAVNVIKVVYENMHCENTCWRGIRAIRDLFVKDDELKARCLEAKADELMLAGLTAFPKSAITQGQCLRGLAAFCFGNDLVRRHCGENGLMKRIVIALETHSDDESVVLHACTALTNMTHNNVDNRMRFQEAGGVEAVLYAISQHWKTSAKITRQGCWALLTLAGTDAVSIDIVESGGAKIICEAMVYHSNDAGVQQFGSWAISNLALANDDIRMQIRKLGIIEVCRIALDTHGQDMEVVRQCRHALGVLGPDTDGGKRGGIGAAVNATKASSSSSSLRPNTSGNKTGASSSSSSSKRMSVVGSGKNALASPQQGKLKKPPGKKTKN